MKRNNNYILLNIIVLSLISVVLYSCSGGAPGLPARKKMPELNSYTDGLETSVPFNDPSKVVSIAGVAITNTVLTLNGTMQGFISVAFPDASTDSATISLINTIKPFAMPMLSAWAQQKRGVLIDLSRHQGTDVFRSDYVLEKINDFSIPVVIIWDQYSSSRVATVKELVEGVPSITLSCTSGNDPAGNILGK